MGHLWPLFNLFLAFIKQTIQLLQQINENKCPSGDEIRTNNLLNMSLLPLPLDQWSRENCRHAHIIIGNICLTIFSRCGQRNRKRLVKLVSISAKICWSNKALFALDAPNVLLVNTGWNLGLGQVLLMILKNCMFETLLLWRGEGPRALVTPLKAGEVGLPKGWKH